MMILIVVTKEREGRSPQRNRWCISPSPSYCGGIDCRCANQGETIGTATGSLRAEGQSYVFTEDLRQVTILTGNCTQLWRKLAAYSVEQLNEGNGSGRKCSKVFKIVDLVTSIWGLWNPGMTKAVWSEDDCQSVRTHLWVTAVNILYPKKCTF